MVAVATPTKQASEGKKATAKLPSPPPQPKMIAKNAGKAAEAACACAKSALVSHPSSQSAAVLHKLRLREVQQLRGVL